MLIWGYEAPLSEAQVLERRWDEEVLPKTWTNMITNPNFCLRVSLDEELRGYGTSIRVKDDTHHGIVKTSEPK